VTLIRPTVDITTTGQTETVDGVEIEFQMTPGTEAPSEMNFYFPGYRALCMAENATHNLHNLLTLRGALVRDPNVWAKYLTEAIDSFVGRSDVAFASHHWPTWGQERITAFLGLQRDLYAYLHDQTLRMVNLGLTGSEIAEEIQLPPALEQAWSTHGYYGSVSHNVKAVYQRYMGWFDGNPASLWQHTPVERASRYVEAMGGADAVAQKARAAFDAGDYRWAAELANHVVFADQRHGAAREVLADTYEQLGYGSETGTWRNFYLSGATELRSGSFGTPVATSAADLVANLTPEMLFDALAIQVDGPRAWDLDLTVDIALTEDGTRYRLHLANGVLTHRQVAESSGADLTITLAHHGSLVPVVAGALGPDAMAEAGITLEGDPTVIERIAGVLQAGDPDFAIVTPDKE
jgi:alkyl sulfatase BDS1-like metallo-beta-lactamase superfamily hydrolase